jgi:hypothetical protein
VPTPKGAWVFETQGEQGISSPEQITVPAGSTLVMAIAYDNANVYGNSLADVLFGALPMEQVASRDSGDGSCRLEVYRCHCASETTGYIAGTWTGEEPPLTALMIATSFTGGQNAAADKTPSAAGSGDSGSSGSTGMLSQAHEMAFAHVLGLSQAANNPANYSGIWTNGQRCYSEGYMTDMCLAEGTSVRTVADAIEASKGFAASIAYVAICATFRAAA